jgi:hypothetical protein
MPGEEGEIEIRQVFEAEDFSSASQPELRHEMGAPVEKR